MSLGNLLRAIAYILHWAINIYIFIIIIRTLISWVGYYHYNTILIWIKRLTDPVFRWVHRVMPYTMSGQLDFSPMVILLVLYLIDSFLVARLLGYANTLP